MCFMTLHAFCLGDMRGSVLLFPIKFGKIMVIYCIVGQTCSDRVSGDGCDGGEAPYETVMGDCGRIQ